MINKRLYINILILILILVVLLSISVKCSLADARLLLWNIATAFSEEDSKTSNENTSKIEKYQMFVSLDKELEENWKEKKGKSIKDITKNQKQTETGFKETSKEREKMFPDEPVNYYGNIEGVVVKLIVNFKNRSVSGSVSQDDGVWYVNAPIVDGVIENINTLSIMTSFKGVIGNREAGREEAFSGSIYGNISEDLRIFEGTLLETVEGVSIEFTATRQ